MTKSIYHLRVVIESIEDGEIFYSNDETSEDALAIEIGAGQFFPKVEEKLPTMRVGERLQFELGPEDAFGPYHDDYVQMVEVAKLPESVRDVGEEVLVQLPNSEELVGIIRAIQGSEAKIDFNHPMAGKVLRVDVTVESIDNPPLSA